MADVCQEWMVVGVHDGDSLQVAYKNKRPIAVRLFGIDAPELQSEQWPAQKQGISARDYLHGLVWNKPVSLCTRDQSSYGRQVVEIFYRNQSVNTQMIRLGYAWWSKWHAPHRDDFRQAANEARGKKMGVWQQANPIPPWKWRSKWKK